MEYGADAETVLMVRKDRVQGLVALAGKKIVYDGDSICAGSAANAGGGYARIIADLTGSEYVNHAVGGGHLCSGVADRHCVADNLPNLPTDGDIYCFQGGINDYWGNAVLGTYTPGDYTGAVDATTVCGALETIFRYALTNFPGKRICFVITHKIQDTAYQTNSAGNTFKDYRDAMAGICQKYSIPFYDAFSESGLNGWNDAQNNLYLTGNANGTPDGCHPNEDGYRLFYVNQLIDLFESGRSSGSAEKGEPGKDGVDGQPGKDGSSGKDGTSVTVKSVSESTEDGGSNVVTFSDGKTLTVKNGKTGADGNDYVLTSADKTEIAELAAELVEVPSGGGVKQVTEWIELINYTATAEDESSVSKFVWTSEEYPELKEARAFILDLKCSKSPSGNYRRLYLNDVCVTWIMSTASGQTQQAYITPDGVVLAGSFGSTTAGLGSYPPEFGMRHEFKTINSPVTKVEFNSWTTGLVTEGATIQLYIAK